MDGSNLIALRIAIRTNIKTVMKFIDQNYIIRVNGKAVIPTKKLICMFCSSSDEITKEHIIPRWIFEKDTERYFDITLNGHSQTYNRSTVPACRKCNAERLNSLERVIQDIFKKADPANKPIDFEECENIIRWLEVIDYKFQVMNISKKFLSPKKGEHIKFLKDFPLYMLLHNKDYSPSKVLTEIRFTLKRLSIKNKSDQINSLVVFRTKNKSDYFFHTLNKFIFFELPRYGIAVFYFYEEVFETNKDAYLKAMEVIKKVYANE